MTGKIINLRQARKRKARKENAQSGTENAARFGVSKSNRNARQQEQDKAARHLDGHKREPGSDD